MSDIRVVAIFICRTPIVHMLCARPFSLFTKSSLGRVFGVITNDIRNVYTAGKPKLNTIGTTVRLIISRTWNFQNLKVCVALILANILHAFVVDPALSCLLLLLYCF